MFLFNSVDFVTVVLHVRNFMSKYIVPNYLYNSLLRSWTGNSKISTKIKCDLNFYDYARSQKNCDWQLLLMCAAETIYSNGWMKRSQHRKDQWNSNEPHSNLPAIVATWTSCVQERFQYLPCLIIVKIQLFSIVFVFRMCFWYRGRKGFERLKENLSFSFPGLAMKKVNLCALILRRFIRISLIFAVLCFF